MFPKLALLKKTETVEQFLQDASRCHSASGFDLAEDATKSF